MRKLAFLVCAFVCLTLPAWAQKTAANPFGAGLSVQDAGTCSTAGSFIWQTSLPQTASTTTVNLAGTFSGTLTIRLSNNGGQSWTTFGTATSAGTTTVNTNGYTDICADVTTYTSGIFQVNIFTGSTGAGGGGSVSLPTTLSAPGVFTGTQMNESFVTSINSCMPSNGSSPAFVTDALTGCVSVPSSGVSNGFSNGVAGYAFNGNACTTCSGYGGPAGAVGVFGKGWATANNGHVWGLDTTSGNDVGTSGNMVFGYEADVYSQGTTPIGAGILLSLRGTTQSTAFPAIDIQTPQSTALWTNALQVDTGAVSSSGDALQVSPFATSAGSNSPPIALIGVNSSGTQQQVFLQARGSTPAAGNLPLVALLIGSFGTSPQTSTVLSFGGATGLGAGTLILSGPLSLPTFTVSTLPSASTAGAGAMVRVSDASTFTVGTCTGGGSDFMIAISNGTTWSCH